MSDGRGGRGGTELSSGYLHRQRNGADAGRGRTSASASGSGITGHRDVQGLMPSRGSSNNRRIDHLSTSTAAAMTQRKRELMMERERERERGIGSKQVKGVAHEYFLSSDLNGEVRVLIKSFDVPLIWREVLARHRSQACGVTVEPSRRGVEKEYFDNSQKKQVEGIARLVRRHQYPHSSGFNELRVTAHIYQNGMPVHSLCQSTHTSANAVLVPAKNMEGKGNEANRGTNRAEDDRLYSGYLKNEKKPMAGTAVDGSVHGVDEDNSDALGVRFVWRVTWNEWLQLPVLYKDLCRDALLVITVWGAGDTPICGTSIHLFEGSTAGDGKLSTEGKRQQRACLRRGLTVAQLWRGSTGDGSLDTFTPSHGPLSSSAVQQLTASAEIARANATRSRAEYCAAKLAADSNSAPDNTSRQAEMFLNFATAEATASLCEQRIAAAKQHCLVCHGRTDNKGENEPENRDSATARIFNLRRRLQSLQQRLFLIEKHVEAYRFGETSYVRVPWMDALTLDNVDAQKRFIIKEICLVEEQLISTIDSDANLEAAAESSTAPLTVSFPYFEKPVVYEENLYCLNSVASPGFSQVLPHASRDRNHGMGLQQHVMDDYAHNLGGRSSPSLAASASSPTSALSAFPRKRLSIKVSAQQPIMHVHQRDVTNASSANGSSEGKRTLTNKFKENSSKSMNAASEKDETGRQTSVIETIPAAPIRTESHVAHQVSSCDPWEHASHAHLAPNVNPWGNWLVVVSEPQLDAGTNPVEQKYAKQVRGKANIDDKTARSLKPNKEEKHRIDTILNAPTISTFSISRQDKELLWKFRYTLTVERRALSKFCLCVDWDDEQERKLAIVVMQMWTPIQVDDALKLLSAEFQNNEIVRGHAVRALDMYEDSELNQYILQLIQALRYEELHSSMAGYRDRAGSRESAPPALWDAEETLRRPEEHRYSMEMGYDESFLPPNETLCKMLIRRCEASPELANFFYWYIHCEISRKDSPSSRALYSTIEQRFTVTLATTKRGQHILEGIRLQQTLVSKMLLAHKQAYASRRLKTSKMIDQMRAQMRQGGTLHEGLTVMAAPTPMPLNPRVLIKGVNADTAKIFTSNTWPVLFEFYVYDDEARRGSQRQRRRPSASPTLSTSSISPSPSMTKLLGPNGNGMDSTEKPPGNASSTLVPLGMGGGGGGRENTRLSLGSTSAHSGSDSDSDSDSALGGNLPRVASWSMEGVGKAFTETLTLAERTAAESRTKIARFFAPPPSRQIFFKGGDDMRQDQLVLQIIGLVDQLWKRVNLDLKLTPFRVLSVTVDAGMAEFVSNSKTMTAVMDKHNKDILSFFREHHPDESAEYGVDPEVIDTFIKSCAGYCVITFILGIGDRHLENIMLKPTGHLWHLDFGFIFGRDPKPWPAPMRITKEMVEGMGGPASHNYKRFQRFAVQAFLILRKNCHMILNLLTLMVDAGIPDLSKFQDSTTVICKVQEKFRLDLSDEQAEAYFLQLVEVSWNAVAPVLADMAHRVAMALKQ